MGTLARATTPARRRRPEMENIGAILFAVFLYVITTELSRFVVRRRARADIGRPGRREAVFGHLR